MFAIFQMTFAIITPALIVGAFAERMRFSAMLLFSALWLMLVYAPVCHWVWGGGWLAGLGVLDFAGGTVVHITAGVAALVAALVLGPRRGFPDTADAAAQPDHDGDRRRHAVGGLVRLQRRQRAGGQRQRRHGHAGHASVGAAAGALAWMTMEWLRHGKPSVLGIVTGMVAGLGTITPASGFRRPGRRARDHRAHRGLVCYHRHRLLKRALKIDDSLDVFPVHGVGGILGTLLAGVFAVHALGGAGSAEGVTMGRQVATQITGILGHGRLECELVSLAILLKLIDATLGLRVTVEQETEGLDTVLHNETGYNM